MLTFNRDATLYRAIVGSIRTVRDYVEGEPPSGKHGSMLGRLAGHAWRVEPVPPLLRPFMMWERCGSDCTLFACCLHCPGPTAGPRIIRPIFAHTTTQEGDAVVLRRWGAINAQTQERTARWGRGI